MYKSKITLGIALLGFALILALPPKALGAGNFSGKSVTLSIAFSVGGGSDRWARVYAPYLSKYLPGNPTVIVRNMPGGAVSQGSTDLSPARSQTDVTSWAHPAPTRFLTY